MCDGKEDGIDVDWVDVSAEPNQVEQFRSAVVRVYEVTIRAGMATLYHRHDRYTVYVITSGGRFRSHEPGHLRSRTSLGRSTGLLSVGHHDLAVDTVRALQIAGHLLQLIRVAGHQNQVVTVRGMATSEPFTRPEVGPVINAMGRDMSHSCLVLD